MGVKKLHAIGTTTFTGRKVTAGNTYMAEGRYAVKVTTDPEKVTCVRCLSVRA